MDITLYNFRGDNKEVNKSLALIDTVQGQLQGDTAVENPKIIIETREIDSFNYCYIPSFNRYYYITSFSALKGQHLLLDLEVDPLNTFYQSFKKSEVIANRSTSNYNLMLKDDYIPTTEEILYTFSKLPFHFSPTDNGKTYSLIIGGN